VSADDLPVGDRIIPGSELSWSFGPSGGPGGQHANRSHTRAELSFDIAASGAFTDEEKHRLLTQLASRLRDGTITVTSDESRSQWRNRAMARRRLANLLEAALVVPRQRRPTRPSRAARRRRLDTKRRRAATKQLRRRPDAE